MSRQAILLCLVQEPAARAWWRGELSDRDLLLTSGLSPSCLFVASLEGRAGLRDLVAALARLPAEIMGVWRTDAPEIKRLARRFDPRPGFVEKSGQIRFYGIKKPVTEYV
jgi:hypothetical protein